MATASPPDPSDFTVSVAVGYAHLLDKVLGFLERTRQLNPVLAISIALPVLVAYLVVVTLAFAVRVAADSYAHIVLANGSGNEALIAQTAVLSPAAVLNWLAKEVVKLAVALLIFGAVVVALFYCTPLFCLPGVTDHKE